MIIEIVGKFYDNHSLAIINRKLAVGLHNNKEVNVFITPLDSFGSEHKVPKEEIKILKKQWWR